MTDLREKAAEAVDAATLAREPLGYVLETVERNRIAYTVLAVVVEHVDRLRVTSIGDERYGVWEEGYADACHDLLIALRGSGATA